MSSAPAPHGPDAHDAHAFTGEPIEALPPDEPRTPGWVPVLGIALFTGATVIFLAGRDGGAPAPAHGSAEPPATATAAAVIARPAPPAAHAPPGAQAPANPQPRNPTPEQRQQLLKSLGDMKAKPAAPH